MAGGAGGASHNETHVNTNYNASTRLHKDMLTALAYCSDCCQHSLLGKTPLLM